MKPSITSPTFKTWGHQHIWYDLNWTYNKTFRLERPKVQRLSNWLLFIPPTISKCGSSRIFSTAHSKLKTATFERLILAVIGTGPTTMAKENISKLEKQFKIHALAAHDSLFRYFMLACYAVHERFYPTKTPTGTINVSDPSSEGNMACTDIAWNAAYYLPALYTVFIPQGEDNVGHVNF